jgi:hypothetical protein
LHQFVRTMGIQPSHGWTAFLLRLFQSVVDNVMIVAAQKIILVGVGVVSCVRFAPGGQFRRQIGDFVLGQVGGDATELQPIDDRHQPDEKPVSHFDNAMTTAFMNQVMVVAENIAQFQGLPFVGHQLVSAGGTDRLPIVQDQTLRCGQIFLLFGLVYGDQAGLIGRLVVKDKPVKEA